jgi:hypothetical protein
MDLHSPEQPSLAPALFEGRVRGALIRSLVDTYETDHGQAALGRLLADLSTESRLACLHGVSESAWYPQQLFVELAWAAWRRLGPEGCIDLAFRSQRRHLLRLRRLVTRAAGPAALLACAAKAWRRYQDMGRLKVKQITASSAVLDVEAQPAILEPGYAEAVLGTLLALVQMAGAARPRGTVTRRPPGTTTVTLAWG